MGHFCVNLTKFNFFILQNWVNYSENGITLTMAKVFNLIENRIETLDSQYCDASEIDLMSGFPSCNGFYIFASMQDFSRPAYLFRIILVIALYLFVLSLNVGVFSGISMFILAIIISLIVFYLIFHFNRNRANGLLLESALIFNAIDGLVHYHHKGVFKTIGDYRNLTFIIMPYSNQQGIAPIPVTHRRVQLLVYINKEFTIRISLGPDYYADLFDQLIGIEQYDDNKLYFIKERSLSLVHPIIDGVDANTMYSYIHSINNFMWGNFSAKHNLFDLLEADSRYSQIVTTLIDYINKNAGVEKVKINREPDTSDN